MSKLKSIRLVVTLNDEDVSFLWEQSQDIASLRTCAKFILDKLDEMQTPVQTAIHAQQPLPEVKPQ